MKGKKLAIIIVVILLIMSVMAIIIVKKGGNQSKCGDGFCDFNSGIKGFVYGPGNSVGVLYIPGGNGAFTETQKKIAEQLSKHGYFVLGIDYSNIALLEDSHDSEILAMKEPLDYLSNNVDKIGIIGTSHGAGITLDIIENYFGVFNNKISVAIEVSGGVDARAVCEYWEEKDKISDCEGATEEELDKYSPILRVNEIKVPLMIVHGKGDSIVPVAEAYNLRNEMQSLGREHEIKIYDTDKHGTNILPMAKEDIFLWFDEYLK